MGIVRDVAAEDGEVMTSFPDAGDYVVTLRHDRGKVRIQTYASSEAAAIAMILKAEHAPPSAVVKVVKL